MDNIDWYAITWYFSLCSRSGDCGRVLEMLKVEEITASCAVQDVLFNSDTLSKIIPYLQTETRRGKTTSDLFNLALTCTRLGISNNGVSLIEQSARIAVDDMIAMDSSLSHWCREGENSLADYHRIRSAQDIQKESLEYLKWMVVKEYDENGRKLVRCNVTDDGQLTFKDINLGGHQRGKRRRDAVLFNSDTLSKIISYLPSVDLLNLAVTCKRFGVSSEDSKLSLIEETARIAIQDIATEEQLATLPYYDGDSSLANYHYLQFMRGPLTFDQLVGDIEYLNKEDKSCVRKPTNYFAGNYATAFSNNIMRAGKHYASFAPIIDNKSSLVAFSPGIHAGVMRPGKANQYARGLPYYKNFYNNFSPSISRGECNNNNSSVQCCVYDISNGNCNTSDWGGDDMATDSTWDGSETASAGDEIGLLLDLDEGSLSVYKNGRKLGVMKRGLAGPFCWVASMWNGVQVTIKRGRIPPN